MSEYVHGIGKLSVFRKLGYGVGNITYSLPQMLIDSFFIFFATVILKINPIYAGGIMALAALWDGVSDPLMGYLSDNTESRRFGRRHQYILWGSIGITVFTYLIWSIDPDYHATVKFWFLLTLILINKTALTIFLVPYNALGAELSTDYDERTSIQSYRAIFYLLGMITAVAVANIYFFRPTADFEQGQLNPAAYAQMGLFFSIVIFVVVVPTFLATRRYIPYLPKRTEKMKTEDFNLANLISDTKAALNNHNFLPLFILIFFLLLALQFGIAVGFHVSTYTYQFNGPEQGMLALMIFLASILSQPIWLWIAKRWDKKTTLYLGIIIALIGFVGGPWTHVWWKFFPIHAKTTLLTLSIFNFIAGIGNGAFMSIPYSMIADVVDVQEQQTGKRDEGLFYGLYTLAFKIGSSISLLISGILLSWIGFDVNLATQTDSTCFQMAMLPTYFLVGFSPIAFYLLSKYKLNRKVYIRVREVLDKRKKEE